MRSPRTRKRRREIERELAKLAEDKEKLFRLQPGGAPARPLRVAASPVVDVRARATRCPLCDGALRLDEHAADSVDGRSLRVARLTCLGCHVPRELWFEIVPDDPN